MPGNLRAVASMQVRFTWPSDARGSGTTNTLAPPIRHRDHPPDATKMRRFGPSLPKPVGPRRLEPRIAREIGCGKHRGRCRSNPRRPKSHPGSAVGKPGALANRPPSPTPFANFANFFHSSNSNPSNQLQPRSLSPMPPSTCPPDTMCFGRLRESEFAPRKADSEHDVRSALG
jgi:hypothetical protein